MRADGQSDGSDSDSDRDEIAEARAAAVQDGDLDAMERFRRDPLRGPTLSQEAPDGCGANRGSDATATAQQPRDPEPGARVRWPSRRTSRAYAAARDAAEPGHGGPPAVPGRGTTQSGPTIPARGR